MEGEDGRERNGGGAGEEKEASFLTEEQRDVLRNALRNKTVDGAAHGSQLLLRLQSKALRGDGSAAGSGGGGNKRSSARRTPIQVERKPRGASGKSTKAKKGGAGGKGTWGTVMDETMAVPAALDRNDPNYESEFSAEEGMQKEWDEESLLAEQAHALESYKQKIVDALHEYFAHSNVQEFAEAVQKQGRPEFAHQVVKKTVLMAMDHKPKEHEMASKLLSGLYPDTISKGQMCKGFDALIESIDDVCLDIPDAVHQIATFMTRAVYDDVLPPNFVERSTVAFPEGSKALAVAQKFHELLNDPHHGEKLERCWIANTGQTLEEVKDTIQRMVKEYEDSQDVKEVRRCILDLGMPFFHHELVKQVLVAAMEAKKEIIREKLVALLAALSKSGEISQRQMSAGFDRIMQRLEDYAVDIPEAVPVMKHIRIQALGEGWLVEGTYKPAEGAMGHLAHFKSKCESILKEYSSSGEMGDVRDGLSRLKCPDYHMHFVKKALSMALDWNDHERELVSVLLAKLYPELLTRKDIGEGFSLILSNMEDLVLDVPDAPHLVSLFLGRAIVDDCLPPAYLAAVLDEIDNTLGIEVVWATGRLLNTRHAAERLLRCWGAGASVDIAEIKESMHTLIAEYTTCEDMKEASTCLHDLSVPFFHHEFVKKALVYAVEHEQSMAKIMKLLRHMNQSGEISDTQLLMGFQRVESILDDLSLDNPQATQTLAACRSSALEEGWYPVSA